MQGPNLWLHIWTSTNAAARNDVYPVLPNVASVMMLHKGSHMHKPLQRLSRSPVASVRLRHQARMPLPSCSDVCCIIES